MSGAVTARDLLEDNRQAWDLHPDGTTCSARPKWEEAVEEIASQQRFLRDAWGRERAEPRITTAELPAASAAKRNGKQKRANARKRGRRVAPERHD